MTEAVRMQIDSERKATEHQITMLHIRHETEIARLRAADAAAERAHRLEMQRNESEHVLRMRELEEDV